MLELAADPEPIAGLIGGIMIGLAGAVMLLGSGRIAGVSGIAARGFGIGGGSMPLGSSWMFLLGLPLGAIVVESIRQTEVTFPPLWALLVAGVLVGFGTRLGSGCTSGHGVCGVSRLSARSLVATAVFICAGAVTVFVMNMLGVTW